MQKNESLQYSSNEKSILEAYFLIYEMSMDKFPKYLPLERIAETDPHVRAVEVQDKQTAWKPKVRYHWLQMNPHKRESLLWKGGQIGRTEAMQKKVPRMKQVREHNEKVIQKGKGSIAYSRWTFDKGARNYDSLIEHYDLKRLDAILKTELKWDALDYAEPGIETCEARMVRHREKHRAMKYKLDWEYGHRHIEFKNDARKLRNLACIETYLLLIEDASPLAWRCAAMAPLARICLESTFNNPEEFNWKSFFFDEETESES